MCQSIKLLQTFVDCIAVGLGLKIDFAWLLISTYLQVFVESVCTHKELYILVISRMVTMCIYVSAVVVFNYSGSFPRPL